MIKVEHLYKSFNGNKVIEDYSIEIRQGETVVIIGRSGVGKSVLLRHLIGITKPDSGTIEVNGKMISSLEGKELLEAVKEMGMLFQGGALFDSLTIEDNVAFYLREHTKLSSSEILSRVTEALEMVDLKDVRNKMPSELSGGMKKRAALARVIVYRPKIILYDEPTTGLDPVTAMHINQLIVRTKKELQATSVVVTHDIHSALFVADRIALHKEGNIKYISNIDDFLTKDDDIIVFMNKILKGDPRLYFKEELEL